MEVDDLQGGGADSTITEFESFEDYLDSQITAQDMYYLEVG